MISKKYFIVIDKNREHKKELLFNVSYYYLKSFNEKKSTFSYVNTPFFKGTVLFGLDIKNKMRPLQFNKLQKDNSVDPVDPRLFKKLLLANENKFITFSSQAIPEDIEPIREMLENFQFEERKIKTFPICDFCLSENKFTLLIGSKFPISHKDKKICSNCALKIVKREAKSSGLVGKEQISPKLKNFFTHMILKFKNVQKILNVIKSDFDPSANRELTLYDIERNPPISKKYLNYKVDDLSIPEEFKQIIKASKITTLLPIQAISIEKGLLSSKDQLIMAPTSGGKTLVGELSGISRVLLEEDAKMLYLVPIVALANIRTEEFSNKYKPLGLKILKRVGESILDRKENDNIEELNDADVIIATYEAIDYILRSGNKEKLGHIGTIVIDEIQTLIDPERGFLLDGFISRLKSLFSETQYLYLSATIGEPAILAKKLNCELIRYNNRPVPIERHLLLCSNEVQKGKYIFKLIRSGFSIRSKFGFKGQSIVFTNTRKKCESIAEHLQHKGILVRAYHSGLTGEERKLIEVEFQSQKIAGVIATAALAAGVDLPAQQVIFESLAMGIKWLTVAEFEQMLGRAGRLKKHEKGYAYLLVEPEKAYHPKMEMTEENIAIKLLNGKIKDFELIPDENKSITELVAFISMFSGVNKTELFEYNEALINNDYDLEALLKKLISMKLVRIKEDYSYRITQLGRAIAKSFLTVDKGLEIIEYLRKSAKTLVELALDIEPLRNVYLTKKTVADLSKNRNMKYLSSNLFTASTLSLLDAEHVKKKKSFSREFIEMIMKWMTDIFNCNCNDKPYCECGRVNLEKLILSLRVEENYSIDEIRDYLETEYNILVFKGDLMDFLETLIYSLESVLEIAKSIKTINVGYKNEIMEIPKYVEKIKK